MNLAIDGQRKRRLGIGIQGAFRKIKRRTSVLHHVIGPALLHSQHVPLRQPRLRDWLVRGSTNNSLQHRLSFHKVRWDQAVH